MLLKVAINGARAPEEHPALPVVTSGLGAACLRVLLEPQEADRVAALRTIELIEAILADGGVVGPRLLHGAGPTAWPLLMLARRRGYDGRIGLEDTLLPPDGRRARDNAELVTVALDHLRRPPTEEEAAGLKALVAELVRRRP